MQPSRGSAASHGHNLWVQLRHLEQDQQQINGRIGRLVDWHGDTFRFVVRVGDRAVYVRAANMHIVDRSHLFDFLRRHATSLSMRIWFSGSVRCEESNARTAPMELEQHAT